MESKKAGNQYEIRPYKGLRFPIILTPSIKMLTVHPFKATIRYQHPCHSLCSIEEGGGGGEGGQDRKENER